MKRFCVILICTISCLYMNADRILLEAEAFSDKGGWQIDQQFMDIMGSPYIIAHGMGRPVQDAETVFNVQQTGTYNVYVRTYNWTSPWYKGKGPGSFCVVINGKRLSISGDTEKTWTWTHVGQSALKKGVCKIALQDMTGFDGRCDAIYLTNDNDVPPSAAPDSWRRQLNPIQTTSQHYDFVVIGGGVGGMCTAVSAARLGLKVALVNNRPVWGGNNSSEIRVHLGGLVEVGNYPNLGRMLCEFGPSRGGNAKPKDYYEDAKKDSFLKAEPNVTLLPNYHAVRVEKQGSKISEVIIRHIESGHQIILEAPLFADCTGDANIGYLAGADFRMGREGSSEFNEIYAPAEPDSLTMGASVQWYSVKGKENFPEFDYGMGFNDDNCDQVLKGEWTWETGMNKNQITQAEQIRDYGLLAVYGTWSWLKNHSKNKARYAHRKLGWVAYLAGKRESRRLMGDYILKEEDILKNVYHEDATCATTWSIDLHFPDSVNHINFPGREYKSATIHRRLKDAYGIPYRCLYSRNVENLFMAGRNVSETHVALGTTRVMRTIAMMGEVVGMAAYLCHKHNSTPRGVYWYHLPELKSLMNTGTGRASVPNNQHYNPSSLLNSKK